MNTNYDIIIVGGGLVGATLAYSLAQLPLAIALIEATPAIVQQADNYDVRSIALSYSSHLIFTGLNLWDKLAAVATPITHIHVSNRGHFAKTRLTAQAANVPALGYVLPVPSFNSILQQALANAPNINILCPAKLETFSRKEGHWQLNLKAPSTTVELTAKLLVAADGTHSQIRAQQNIGIVQHHYNQHAIVTNVTTALPHQYTAYERFTPTGPLALLPLKDHQCAVVWTLAPQQAEQICALPPEQFLPELQRAFGYRLGKFTAVGTRAQFPLTAQHVTEQVKAGLVILGNAAHMLHPVAGQGLNLSLRDVAALAEVIATALTQGDDFSGLASLQRYARWRYPDQQHIQGLTHNLVHLFSHDFWPISILRNLGLLALENFTLLKQHLADKMMGLSTMLPRLARGLPLNEYP